ncbi:MAG: hypothetical protein EPN82_07535 [Bacteroidetes bacterium]|nr:MAG: hypothetical protein EPN82_07535 [Bacteroidota bacterium]
MTHKIITPNLQGGIYQFDSQNVFYSIGENYIEIHTPERKILLNYDFNPKFVPGGKDHEDMQIITTNHNLKEIELSALEKYKVKPKE